MAVNYVWHSWAKIRWQPYIYAKRVARLMHHFRITLANIPMNLIVPDTESLLNISAGYDCCPKTKAK